MNKKNNPMKETINLRITKREKDKIEKRAKENNITPAELIRETMRKSFTNKATSAEQKLVLLQAYVDDLIEAVTAEYGKAGNAKIQNLIKEMEQI